MVFRTVVVTAAASIPAGFSQVGCSERQSRQREQDSERAVHATLWLPFVKIPLDRPAQPPVTKPHTVRKANRGLNPSLTISSQAHTRSAMHGTPAAWSHPRKGRAGRGNRNL